MATPEERLDAVESDVKSIRSTLADWSQQATSNFSRIDAVEKNIFSVRTVLAGHAQDAEHIRGDVNSTCTRIGQHSVRLDALEADDVVSRVGGFFGRIKSGLGSVVKSSIVSYMLVAAISAGGALAVTQHGCTIPWTPPVPVPAPDPKPIPLPSPLPVDGFRVGIIYETADLAKLPAGQNSIIYGGEVLGYLAQKLARQPDGKTPDMAFIDKDADLSQKPQYWRDARDKVVASPDAWDTASGQKKFKPWLIVSNPQKGGGFSGPLPADVPSAMTILKRFGD